MSLISSLVCVNCSQIYDESRKPCVGTCNDSVCQACRNQMKVFTCPTCGKKDAFKEEKINYHGLPMQRSILEKLTEDNIEEFIKKQNQKNSGLCGECGDFAPKLRICLDCALDREIIVPISDEFTINLSGVTILGGFYKAKQFSICANCATDGKHAGHEIGLLADVYEEKEVDFELNMSLIRILDLKLTREMKKNERNHRYFLYYYKQRVVRIERSRLRSRDKQFGFLLQHEPLREIVNEELLYERRIQMLYVEDIQKILEASEDEEFKEEMRKVAGKILKEEEKLGEEDLERVNQLVKDRILKHCQSESFGETVIDDCKRSLKQLMKARISLLDQVQACAIAGQDYQKDASSSLLIPLHMRDQILSELPELKGDVWIKISTTTEKNKIESFLNLLYAQIAYSKAYAEQSLCVVTHMETMNLLKGECSLKLNHPNLCQYLCLFQLQNKFDPVTNDVETGNVLHFK